MANQDKKSDVTSPGYKNAFEDDTDRITLPRPTPERTDDEEDEKKADNDRGFDDLDIEVDQDELAAETESDPSRHKKF